ncbi:MAG: hypothetical protein ACFFG0_07205 [Candidatus Thorarchaeota archaeon]
MSVIIGALIVAIDYYRLGKFLISLGTDMGLINLIIFLVSGIFEGSIPDDVKGIILGIVNDSYGFLGILLTIIVRFKLKKD